MVGKLTLHHNFLAQQLGTKFATTPVHTIEESTLFKKLMKDNNVQLISASDRIVDSNNTKRKSKQKPKTISDNNANLTILPKELDWIALTKSWNVFANGRSIFYKLPEQLLSYFKSWMRARAEENSLHNHAGAEKNIQDILLAQSRHIITNKPFQRKLFQHLWRDERPALYPALRPQQGIVGFGTIVQNQQHQFQTLSPLPAITSTTNIMPRLLPASSQIGEVHTHLQPQLRKKRKRTCQVPECPSPTTCPGHPMCKKGDDGNYH
ncbi:hypothetical protein BJ742DRAFT_740424 [Cladochytrium replicatum]|nr:hypothetical protein BJ742DRAFT_744203 [Cladochytrium replicatum]KAI8806502.1 hypothetical protein BJ742DRAFT_740424 [Cladochytrium replicatum]